MKENNILKSILLLILVLTVVDGEWRNPSVLDIIKIVLLVIALIVTFKGGKQNDNRSTEKSKK